ncbi:glutaredoxin domain-containing protein [Alkalibacter mobilis]|uniref:glutaredoxin domain-containing protein n=1 Tax=Alkalibacter mobilis TaxID=2787712 RepID=UPI00189E115F|nr:glutaredoxin domain-containing protein [Alkalibacter mobilis]MBF7096216.1 glutaredoxin family protein [Alkalibacter mobilis]
MKKVTMYTTDTCPYCRSAKEFLKANDIHFTEKNASRDMEAQREMAQKNLRGVPSFVIGDEVVVGLNKDKILAAVDHRLVTCGNCGSKMRVPVNKGTVKVTCPKCGHVFDWSP